MSRRPARSRRRGRVLRGRRRFGIFAWRRGGRGRGRRLNLRDNHRRLAGGTGDLHARVFGLRFKCLLTTGTGKTDCAHGATIKLHRVAAECRGDYAGRRSLMDCNMAAMASALGLAPWLPLPWRRTLTLFASMSRGPTTSMVWTRASSARWIFAVDLVGAEIAVGPDQVGAQFVQGSPLA